MRLASCCAFASSGYIIITHCYSYGIIYLSNICAYVWYTHLPRRLSCFLWLAHNVQLGSLGRWTELLWLVGGAKILLWLGGEWILIWICFLIVLNIIDHVYYYFLGLQGRGRVLNKLLKLNIIMISPFCFLESFSSLSGYSNSKVTSCVIWM